MNGRVCNDPGNYTYISHTGKSLVDYVLASPSFLNTFCYFKVGMPNILSDHCTVSFSLKCNDVQNVPQTDDKCDSKIRFTYKWDPNKIDMYKQSLTDVYFQNSIQNLTDACCWVGWGLRSLNAAFPCRSCLSYFSFEYRSNQCYGV
jgi:hypothetical protein